MGLRQEEWWTLYTGDISMALTGDSFIANRISAHAQPEYLRLFEIIRAHDIGFTNLEFLLNDFKGTPAAQSGGTYAGAWRRIVDDLSWAGFQFISRANNHALDYSYTGLRLTSKTLDEAGLTHAGVGEDLAQARAPSYRETAKGRVALLSACSTFAPWGRAGQRRPDFVGRPGLSPLRYETVYRAPPEELERLGELERRLGLHHAEKKRRQFSYRKGEDEEITSFAGLRFAPGPEYRVETRPHAQDVEDILKYIRDARRQSDWVLFSLHAHESQLESHLPADFIVSFARRCVEAGADVFIGHGPHLLRGIEIYQGKPIFYSLGNFFFQNDLVERQPQEIYDQYRLGPEATVADLYDRRSQKDQVGFPSDPVYWETVLALLRWKQGALTGVELVPVSLGYGKPRSQRGRPVVATGSEAVAILDRLAELSGPWGTEMHIQNERGRLVLGN